MEQGKKIYRETDGEAVRLAKTLLRSARFGALAVIDPSDGAPLASRVAVATDVDGSPLILVSTLAAHTAAIAGDQRCSLLVGEPGKGDPLAHPRLTLACAAARLERNAAEHAQARRRYLNRHPKASLYADFGDFSFFRLAARGALLNGGFGRAYLLDADDIILPSAQTAEIAAGEQSAIDHMNADHADAVQRYAAMSGGKPAGTGWRLVGIDPEGVDLVRGDICRRVFFPQIAVSMIDLRTTLVEMARASSSSS